jgi:hypothetical protein
VRNLLIAFGLVFVGWVAGILTNRITSHRLTTSSPDVQQPLPTNKPIGEGTILASGKESHVRVSSESIKADLLAAMRESNSERGIFTALNVAQLEDIRPLL